MRTFPEHATFPEGCMILCQDYVAIVLEVGNSEEGLAEHLFVCLFLSGGNQFLWVPHEIVEYYRTTSPDINTMLFYYALVSLSQLNPEGIVRDY